MEEITTPDSLMLQIDNGNIPYLAEAAKWAKFLAIMGFILCGFLVIAAIFAGTVMSSYSNQLDTTTPSNILALGSGFLTAIYLIAAALYFIFCLYLFNFASKMHTALRNNDQVYLNNSLKNLKSYFKFKGILLIIVLCFYAVIIIFAIIGGTLFH